MRRRMLVSLGVLAVALGGVLAYGLTHQGEATPAASGIDPHFHRYLAPQLPDRTLDGKPFSLRALRGKPVVVNFWASWCLPCRKEVPELVAVSRRWAGRAYVVGVDTSDRRSAGLRFARTHGMRYPIVGDPSAERALDYRAGGTPWTFIVDRRGIVVDQLAGGTTARAIEAKLDDLVRT